MVDTLQTRPMVDGAEKLMTFVVPCYNSSAYMDHCIGSIIDAAAGRADIELIIVDDGSTKDDTLARARDWERRYPGMVRAVHQQNGGHGEAVNTGLALASGAYFKVIDSDDWLDVDAARRVFDKLTELAGLGGDGAAAQDGSPKTGDASETSGASETGGVLDLMVCNYVYEHESDNVELPVRYEREFPQGRVFGWDDMIGKFPPWQYMMMHSVIYRTKVLRDCGLKLPSHTFYVDEIFVYVPLPHVRTIYYLDVDLYRYFIGRSDQSVNESVMIRDVTDQLRVARIKIDSVKIPEDVPSRNLRRYMVGDLTIVMGICTAFTTLSDRPDHFQMRDDIWRYLKAHDRRLWHRIRWSFIGIWCNFRTPLGVKAFIWGYHKVQGIFKFN